MIDVKKSLLKKINLVSNSPFLGAELAIKTKYKGYNVNEVGIHTYPRTFGRGSSVSSLVLHLLDVHQIDPVKYNLDYKEFLR